MWVESGEDNGYSDGVSPDSEMRSAVRDSVSEYTEEEIICFVNDNNKVAEAIIYLRW